MLFDLESLSLISGAQEYPEVWKLFTILDQVDDQDIITDSHHTAQTLRADKVVEHTNTSTITHNFPVQDPDGSLVL